MRNDTPLFRNVPTQMLVAPTDLGLIAIPEFIRRIRGIFAGDQVKHLVVDLSSVRHIGDGMFRLLLWAHGHALSCGGVIEFLAPPQGTLTATEALALRRLHAPIPRAITGAQPVP